MKPYIWKKDEAHEETDNLIQQYAEKTEDIYAQALQETRAKLEKYLNDFERKEKKKYQDVQQGKITQEEYNQWRLGQVMISKRWEEITRTLAEDFNNSQRIANSMLIGYMEEAYALNHNYSTFMIEKSSMIDTSFTLYNRSTVERLIRDDPDLLSTPNIERQIKNGELTRWNKTNINRQVTQGILQGESIPQIAKRMANVENMNRAQSFRTARTYMTMAQNAGRQASADRAEQLGIKIKKMWVATLDGRTRPSHRKADGQEIDNKEMFTVGTSEMEYPCDPNGAPEEIYNCRCTMITYADGYGDSIRSHKLETQSSLKDMTYDEWKNIRRDNQGDRTNVVNGDPNAINTFERSPHDRFEIEKAIKYQGYDAINAKGHGESDSYTVVLNRTKLIIRGEDND